MLCNPVGDVHAGVLDPPFEPFLLLLVSVDFTEVPFLQIWRLLKHLATKTSLKKRFAKLCS